MAGFAYYVIQRNDTINDNIFHKSDGMQGVYSKMLGVVHILYKYKEINACIQEIERGEREKERKS